MPFFLETWKVCTFFKEVLESSLCIFERLLQGVRRRLSEPGKLVLPLGQEIGHCHVTNKLPARLVVCLLQGQCLVIDKPTRSDKAAHIALLLTIWQQLVFKGLQAFHGFHCSSVYEKQQGHSSRQKLRFPNACAFGFRDQMPSWRIHQRGDKRSACNIQQRVQGLRGRIGRVRRGKRLCAFVGELSGSASSPKAP